MQAASRGDSGLGRNPSDSLDCAAWLRVHGDLSTLASSEARRQREGRQVHKRLAHAPGFRRHEAKAQAPIKLITALRRLALCERARGPGTGHLVRGAGGRKGAGRASLPSCPAPHSRQGGALAASVSWQAPSCRWRQPHGPGTAPPRGWPAPGPACPRASGAAPFALSWSVLFCGYPNNCTRWAKSWPPRSMCWSSA
jgi:hypothetical protein